MRWPGSPILTTAESTVSTGPESTTGFSSRNAISGKRSLRKATWLISCSNPVVSTGGTLRANQLRPVTTILHSEAVIAGPDHHLDDGRQEIADLLLRRLDGAVQLKEARLLMLRAGREVLDQVLPLLPGGHEPTLMGVEGRDEVAIQMLVHGSVSWARLEDLKRAGAQGLMVLPVESLLA